MTTVKRSVRLSNDLLNKLRDLRDSHITPIPVSQLINRCLRSTRGQNCEKRDCTPRNNSEKVVAYVDAEFEGLPHEDIVTRVTHAMKGVQLDQYQIEINRAPKPFYTDGAV